MATKKNKKMNIALIALVVVVLGVALALVPKVLRSSKTQEQLLSDKVSEIEHDISNQNWSKIAGMFKHDTIECTGIALNKQICKDATDGTKVDGYMAGMCFGDEGYINRDLLQEDLKLDFAGADVSTIKVTSPNNNMVYMGINSQNGKDMPVLQLLFNESDKDWHIVSYLFGDASNCGEYFK